MSETPPPKVIINLPDPYGPYSFDTIAEANKWWIEQIEFNSTTLSEGVSAFRDSSRVLGLRADEIRRVFDACGRQSDAQDREEIRRNYCEQIRRQFIEGRMVPRNSQRGEFIAKLWMKSKQMAAGAMAYFSEQGVDAGHIVSVKVLAGISAAQLWEIGGAERLVSDQAAFDNVGAQWKSEIVKNVAALQAERDSLHSQSAAAVEQIDGQVEQFKKTSAAQAGAFKKMLDDRQADFEKLKNEYDRDMAVRRPVLYWRQQKRLHDKRAKKRTIYFGVSIAFALGVLTFVTIFILRGIPDTPQNTSLPHENVLWRVAVFLLVATFSIWIVRVCSRLMLSEYHLATDADQRAIMAQTYLALIRRNAITDKQEEVILKALFRHTATGLVKDDASPPTTWGMLSK